MKEVDFIIVGAGLAGCLLAKELQKNGHSFHIFHAKSQNSASKIAIGLVNPITGKRLVKSWLIDELIPLAIDIYQSLSEELNSQLLHECNVARIIPNENIFRQWETNFNEAVEQGYINPTVKSLEIGNQSWNYFEIKQCFWVDVPFIVSSLEAEFEKNEELTNCTFSFDDLEVSNSVEYQNVKAKAILFCEGWRGVNNPYYKHLPFNLNKGEVADMALDDYSFQEVLKKNIFILPTKNGYKVGSTYEREEVNEYISEKAKSYFIEKLSEIGIKGQILNQKASIRPATKDRRPFIGPHHQNQNVYIFNGFGAKGVSLIPYFAKALVKELTGGEKVIKEASTRRFVIP